MEARFKKVINPADASFITKIDVIPDAQKSVWHYHNEFELIFMIHAKGTGFVGDNISAISTGEVLLLGENLPHTFQRDNEYYNNNPQLIPRSAVIQFNKNFIGADIWNKTEFIPIYDMLNKAKRGLRFYGHTAEIAGSIIMKMTIQKGLKNVLNLLAVLEKLSGTPEHNYISSCGFADRFDEHDEKINKVYNYTINNFKNDITLEKIASLVYLSQSAFCRYFKSKTSKTYSEFLTEVRIGYACKLLLKEKLNISEICYECGYRNLSNFNRQFKEVTKTTPSEYHKYFQRLLYVEEYAA